MSQKILYLDIETSPALFWGYSMFNQNFSLPQIERKPGIIGWGSAWEGKKARWYDGPELGNEGNLEVLWRQLDEADVVVHFNGQRFDMPWVQREMIRLRIMDRKPFSPVHQIDLLKQVKRITRNVSNKLQFTSTDLLGLEGKTGDSALVLWLEIWAAQQAGDEKALQKAIRKMARYCRQDVDLLPEYLNEIRPWAQGLRANLESGGCPKCGSLNVQSRGTATTATGTYQRFHCQDCGGWSRGTSRESGADLVDLR